MDRTLGDEEAFSQGTVAEVLEIVQKAIKAEDEARLAAEQERSARLEQELQGTRSELTEVKKRKERDEEFRRMRRERLANQWARWISRTLVLVVGGSPGGFCVLCHPGFAAARGTSNGVGKSGGSHRGPADVPRQLVQGAESLRSGT